LSKASKDIKNSIPCNKVTSGEADVRMRKRSVESSEDMESSDNSAND